MEEAKWNELMMPLAGISKLTDKLLAELGELKSDMNLPDDEAGAEFVLIEALIARHDAEEALLVAEDRYRLTQRNWCSIRLKRLKEDRIKAEAAKKAVEAMNLQPVQQQTEGG